jgi:hypothetical protein
MSAMKDSIPMLITKLEQVGTQYAYERRYIGEAVTYLRHLYDLLDAQPVKQIDETTLGQ